MSVNFFATAPLGLTRLLHDELRDLGATSIKSYTAGAAFTGALALGYRVCLWSRLASRVLLELARFPARHAEALYDAVLEIDWPGYFAAEQTFAVSCTAHSPYFPNTHYAALKAKDAVVDRFRLAVSKRPSVDPVAAALRIHLHIEDEQVIVYLDLSGDSLHRRGYRERGVAAPLKENLAAALLQLSGWASIAARGGALVDPMCGSGTLPIEAALIAADAAPGLRREHFGFYHWRGHDPAQWQSLVDEAQARRTAGLARLPKILGYDADPKAITAALANIEQAGLRGHIHVERRSLTELRAPATHGLMIVNPPYGERLGETHQLLSLYAQLGDVLKTQFQGWHAAVLTGDRELGFRIGIRARQSHTVYNGALECQLLRFDVQPEAFFTPHAQSPLEQSEPQREAQTLLRKARALHPEHDATHAEMFANRLRKNHKTLAAWAAREGIGAYRLYDADLPDFNLAVDLYQCGECHAVVSEYAAPKVIDPAKAEARLLAALAVLLRVLDLTPERLHLKVRRRQKREAQYEKHADVGEFLQVEEQGLKFLVNLRDYLDTGLFLDHRQTRGLLRSWAPGKRFLNLFAYTGAATVYAAAGGASATTTVDLSPTYLAWAQRNLAINQPAIAPGGKHEFIHADCLAWLAEELRYGERRRRYELIFVDPPTFSNSKRMARNFDIQRDYVALIDDIAQLLAPAGLLVFSTNRRDFKLDEHALPRLICEDITARTIPKDYARNPKIHQCWKIRRAD